MRYGNTHTEHTPRSAVITSTGESGARSLSWAHRRSGGRCSGPHTGAPRLQPRPSVPSSNRHQSELSKVEIGQSRYLA